MSEVTPIRPQITVRPDLVEGPARDTDVTSDLRYWAFLSYSHHDKLIAKRLQRQLETYRVPRRLIGRETSTGPVPARVTPVFRDRDELHAGADLKASVQDALSRSRWLIVVCTPDAARSPWVNREIIEFKKLRGERHVLALIARGEPFASDMPGREAEECFPPALRRALTPAGLAEGEPLEPIAADMRKHGDGPQRAMLKLLAGMVGVSFDDLARRDLQRRVRLLSAVAGLSVLGVMGFAVLAVMAVKARNEAQHQRVQAEGLIEFMLGDLRKKLEPVGRLEVLDSVGEKALAYYGAQEAGKLDATALGHRSRAMHLIGEIRDLRGNPVEAQKAFEQAASTTARLLAQAPQDPQRIFDHAQSSYWVGYAAWKRSDGKDAEKWWQSYLALAERLRAKDAFNVDWGAEVAWAHLNMGTVQLGTGQPAEAVKSLFVARELFADLQAARPGLRLELANVSGWLAIAYAYTGEYENALREQIHQLEMLRTSPDRDKNRLIQRGVLQSLTLVGMYQLALGQASDAEASSLEALKLADELLAVDPGNLFWRTYACIAHLREAEALSALARRADAQAALSESSKCVSQLNSLGSAGVANDIQVRARSLKLASLLDPPSRRMSLIREASQFLDESVPRLGADMLDRVKLSVELANVAIVLGELQVTTDPGAAKSAWKRAETLLAPFESLPDGSVLTPLAQTYYYLGNTQRAEALVVQIQRTSYRHPAYVGLVKKLQAERGGSRNIKTSGTKP